jgi:hypothetical protein
MKPKSGVKAEEVILHSESTSLITVATDWQEFF